MQTSVEKQRAWKKAAEAAKVASEATRVAVALEGNWGGINGGIDSAKAEAYVAIGVAATNVAAVHILEKGRE